MTAFLSVLVLAASPLAAPSALATPALCSTAPALCASAPAPAEPPNSARSVATKSLCTADCGQFNSNVSCSGTVCDAVNQSCPGEQGHVTCDGQTYYCAPCCTDGQLKTVITGPTCGCEDGQSTPRDRYKCVNGEWVYQFSFCGGPFCPAP